MGAMNISLKYKCVTEFFYSDNFVLRSDVIQKMFSLQFHLLAYVYKYHGTYRKQLNLAQKTNLDTAIVDNAQRQRQKLSFWASICEAQMLCVALV